MRPVGTNIDTHHPVEATTGSISTNYSEKEAATSSARSFQAAATETVMKTRRNTQFSNL
jgi:hypothetical protein